MAESIDTCPVWGDGFQAEGYYDRGNVRHTVTDSPRAGGGYVMDFFGQSASSLDTLQKARLTTMLIDRRLQGDILPRITGETVEEAKRRSPLSVPERAERLLQYFANQSEDIGAGHYIGLNDASEWGALAWSESTEWFRVLKIAEYLATKDWIKLSDRGDSAEIEVLVDGFDRIAERTTNVDSSQAFVAMWFDEETDAAFEDAIRPAILNAGFKPVRIDRELNVDKIDDAIIANIRRSRFLVADFTHGKDGARGGVYYEAGLAHGLNLPVIFTCRRDMVDKLHFDTRQYVHILWDTNSLGNLYAELLDRIGARIGEGPETRANS